MDSYWSNFFGSSRIWVGDDPTPFSETLTLATKTPFTEGGFINLDQPVKGRYIVLRRDGAGLSGHAYTICQIKVYAVTNLLQYDGATILKAPESTYHWLSAENLITNLGVRSVRADWHYRPLSDA